MNTAAGMQHLPEGKAFQKRYLNPGPIDRWRGNRLSNESELKKKLNEYVDYHKGGGDESDMPSVTSRTIPVIMSRRQSDLYRAGMGKLPKGVKVNSDNIDRLKAYFTGPRQVSNSSNAFEPGSNEEPKLDRAYADLTQHLKNPKGKALIYSNWLDHGIKPIQRRLDADKTPYGIFTGKESPKVRDQHIRDYNENRTRALLVSSSGAEGLDLKGTRMVQVLEPHFNNSKIRQVVGRSARMGSHSALGPEDRNVEVRQYIARPRNRFFPGSSKGVEDMLAESSRKKDEVDRQITRLLSSKMKPIQLRSRRNLIQFATQADVLRHLAGTRWADDPTGTHQEILKAATSRARNETYVGPDNKRYVGQGQNMRAAKTTDMLDSTSYAKAKDYQEKVLGNQNTAINIATAGGKDKGELQQNIRNSYKPPVNRDGTPATINRKPEIIRTRNQLARGIVQQRSILQSARRQQGIPEPKPLKDFLPFKDNAAPFPEYSERPLMDKGTARAESPIEAEARKIANARAKVAEGATQKLLIKTNAALDDTSKGSVMQTEQASIRSLYRKGINNLKKRVSSKLAEQARIAGRPIKNPDGVAWSYVKPLAANVKVLRPGEKGMPAIEVPQNPAERYRDLADITGDTPERIEKLHKGFERARKAPDDMVRRRVIRSGRIFRNVAEAAKPIPLPTKFPLLKGIGIGAGILGAGYLGAKLLDRKNNQKQLMSSRAKLIRFAWKSGEKVNSLVNRLLLKDAARKMAKAIKPNSVLALPEPLPNRMYGSARYRQIKHIDPSMTEDAAEAMRGLSIHRVADAPTGTDSIVRVSYTNPGRDRTARAHADQLRDIQRQTDRAAMEGLSMGRLERRRTIAAAAEQQRGVRGGNESRYEEMTRDRIRKEEGQRIGKVTGVKIADIRDEARAEVRAANNSNQNQMKEAKAAYDSGRDEINQKIAKIKRNSLKRTAAAVGSGAAIGGGLGWVARKPDEETQFSSLVRFAEKKPLHPSIVAGLSAGTTGALIAGIPSALRIGSKVGPTLKIAGKVGGTLGGLAAGSVLIGNAISGDPRKGETAAYTKRAAIGGGIGGTIGGTVAGLLAMKTPKGRAWMAKHAKDWRPVAWANRVGPAGAAVVGGLGAGGYGVYQGIDEGSGVDALHGGKIKRMSSQLAPIQFKREDDEEMSSRAATTYLSASKVHGVGQFAGEKIKAGAVVGVVALKAGSQIKVTSFGSKVNHSDTPNCALIPSDTKDVLLAIRDIRPGEELLASYSRSPAYYVRLASKPADEIQFFTLIEALAAAPVAVGVGAGVGALSQLRKKKEDRQTGRAAKRGALIGAALPPGMIAGGLLTRHGAGFLAGGALAAGGAAYLTRKKEQQMSSKARSIRFAADEIFVNQGFTGKLAQDRYRKKIKDEDLDRRDANILRSTLAGAGLGAALRGTMPAKYRALIGAGAGAATAIGTRLATRQTADPYGERSREAKTIEGLPYKLAGAAAIGVAGKRGYDKLKATKIAAGKLARGVAGAGIAGLGLYGASQLFSSRRPVIQFEDWDRYYDAPKLKKEYRPQVKKRDWTTKWVGGTSKSGKPIEVNTSRRVADLRRTYSRATGLVGDVKGVLTGEKSVDARGRPKKREWEKPWVQNAAAGLVLGGLGIASVGVRRAAQSGVMRDIADRISDGRLVGRLAKDYPRIGKLVKGAMGIKPRLENEAAGLVQKGEGLGHKLLRYIDEGKTTPVPKLNEVDKKTQDELKARLDKLNKDINTSAREQLNSIIRFDEYEKDPTAAGRFTLRDPRGRSVRVYAGDKGPHYRTPQRELDKKKYLGLKYAALLGSGLVAGTAFGAFGGNPLKNKIAKSVLGQIPTMA